MVKTYKKIATHTVTDETIVGRNLYCDCCGKQIVVNDDKASTLYYTVFHGHNDWGNDSVDSHRHEDLCSFECLQKSMEQFYCKYEPNSSTAFYEIERERWYYHPYIAEGDEEVQTK